MMKDAKPYPLSQNHTKLDNDDYRFLECYLDATKSNLFFAKNVLIVEGPSEKLLLPTIARLLGRDLAEYGVSIVNVRSTGLRRYARIFQRKDETNILKIKVACIVDRDIMPDCAPGICINEKYVDTSNWPSLEEDKRRWRAEADFPKQTDKDAYIDELKKRVDGQWVKTFVANCWTLEYDLAFSGLSNEIVEAIVKVRYVPNNQTKKMQEIQEKLLEYKNDEQKASYIYSFFWGDSTSKAEADQQLEAILDENMLLILQP